MSEGKAAHTTIVVFLTYSDSMLSPVRNTVILQCFVVVGWATGRASATTITKSLLLGTGLTRSNSGKNGPGVYVCVCSSSTGLILVS